MPWKVMWLVLTSRRVFWQFNSVFGIEIGIHSSSASLSG